LIKQSLKTEGSSTSLRSFLYYLAPAMRPRMLMTLDPEGALLPTPVRVGQAVDVVAQAGRPKAITGAALLRADRADYCVRSMRQWQFSLATRKAPCLRSGEWPSAS